MARVAVLVSNPCVGDARVIKMARAAAAAGHEVHVFATSGVNAPPFEHDHGVQFHRLDWQPAAVLASWGPVAWLRKVSRPLANRLIRALIPFMKYRLFGRVFCEHVVAIAPDIVHAHDLICLPAGAAAADAANARLVYDSHELEIHRNPPLPYLHRRFVAHVQKKHARKASAVITVGELVSRELSAHIGRSQIHVLYNAPPLQECPRKLRSDLQLHDDDRLILYVGKVTEGRGVGEILALLPKLPGIHFATVGPCDPRTRLRLEIQARKLGLATRFRILPPVPFDQVVGYIQGADLGVISVEPVTLSYQYCMPNKLFELSFANIPIVSNKLDEIEMYLAELGNGEIADFEQRSALAYTMFRMLQEKHRYVMDEATLARLHGKYSWQQQERKLLALYEQVLAR
jgi:glycosyltransferase involved in cell wall biosynthesis